MLRTATQKSCELLKFFFDYFECYDFIGLKMLRTAMRAVRNIMDSKEKKKPQDNMMRIVKKFANSYYCESFDIANPSF